MARKRKQKQDYQKPEDQKLDPVVHDYEDHDWCVKNLTKAMDAHQDSRERAREAHAFVTTRNGQWEDEWWAANDGKPRYTFDLTTPIIEQIAGELEQADFAIEVDPAGGETTKDDAEIMAGLVRSIENMSDAKLKVYNKAARGAITCGMDGWRIVQKYVDADSFDQDLVIEWIPNYIDRVWHDLNSEEQDHCDRKHTWVLSAMTPDDYSAEWPDRDPYSASIELNDKTSNSAFWSNRDVVIVGELYYIKQILRTLVLMSDGSIYEVDEKYDSIKDELEQAGITEVSRRKRILPCVYLRKFDAKGWLDEPEKTVFKLIPVVTEYANFKIVDNKILYHGAVEKVMDAQRVLNYSLSREIEEGALAPREKIWLTPKQAEGHLAKLSTLNTNADPVQFYNVDERLGPNQVNKTGGAQVNPGLRTISMAMNEILNQAAGMFAANMGDNPNAQSGVAIRRLQDKGDNGTYGYTRSHEVALCYTFRVLAGAIPEVYGDQREVRIINEDDTQEVVALNQTVFDQQQGKMVTLNDLSAGVYKVTCQAGPAFQNRMEQTVEAIVKAASVDPTGLQLGGDIFYKNLKGPGLDLIGERIRRQLFNQGAIPFTQLTEDEREELMQAQQAQEGQPPQEDPAILLGQAEVMKAQTQQQEAAMRLQLQQRRENREDAKFQSSAQNEQVKLMMGQQKQMIDAISAQAEILNKIREAMGAQAIASPDAAEAYQKQAESLSQSLGEGIMDLEYDPLTGVIGNAPTV